MARLNQLVPLLRYANRHRHSVVDSVRKYLQYLPAFHEKGSFEIKVVVYLIAFF